VNPLNWYRSRVLVPGHRESRSQAAWTGPEEPRRILVIRFHAIGDVALVLPACNSLRQRYPNARIDFLTSPATAPLCAAIRLFDSVSLLDRPTNRLQELRALITKAMGLRRRKYDVVLDLQRNWKSRLIRRIIHPSSWGEFDRFGMLAACQRTLHTFHNAGFAGLEPDFLLEFNRDSLDDAAALLCSRGWQPGESLVLLNPAGLWETRQWLLENYLELARSWPGAGRTRFLLLGTDRLDKPAEFLSRRLGDRIVNLAGQTSLEMAFSILNYVDVAITEDSGLMHMAWSLGVPVVALFGSSRHYWSLPTGERVRAFHSGDLPCGACMKATCRFGDNRCMTRITPEAVSATALILLNSYRTEQRRQ
jgi:heptosyltransferase II